MNLRSVQSFRDELMKIGSLGSAIMKVQAPPHAMRQQLPPLAGAQLGGGSDSTYRGLGGTGDSLQGANPTCS